MRMALVLVSAWLGAAILFAGVVAPAAFAVLPSRSLAGALVGRVLPALFIGGLIVGLLGLWLARGDRAARDRVRQAALVTLAASCAVAQLGVAPRIARLRAEMAEPLESLPVADPRRAAFGRLHAISVAWLGLAMAGAVVAVIALSPPLPRGRPAAPESKPLPTSR